ncbi:MAG: OsmC family protein [Firmicutes bacterium]|nr:OsmC family protein [Bacillota bacterium]
MAQRGMSVTVGFRGGMAFESRGPSGHAILLDAAAEAGGADSAARPMEALLAALGSCSGIDVVHILRKMRIPFDGLEIRIDAARRDEHPRIFTGIDLEYVVRGRGLAAKRARVEEAVRLSQEKYCSVAGMLRPAAELRYRVTIEDPDANEEEN